MSKLKYILLLLSGLVLQPCLAVEQGDLEREARLRNQIVDMILDGDPVSLTAGEHEFLGIYTEADSPKAGVIILHGRGFHPDWQDVANPLRTGLIEHDYTTLSLQMPVLEKDAKYYDYVPLFDAAIPRIEAGIAYLREQGVNKIVLLAHSCGAHMAMHWIGLKGDGQIDAFVGIGMGATDYKQYMSAPFPLDKMTVPVFDIYGEEDYPAVIKMAPERLAMIEQTGQAKAAQRAISGANHYFTDAGDTLTEEIAAWLDTLDFE